MTENDRGSTHDARRLVLCDRVHRHNAPLDYMFAALTENRSWWLRLQPGEVEPRILEAVTPKRVVWSSFWPVSPADTIEFDLSSGRGGTAIRFRWYTDSPPDERGIGITRQRLNRKFGGDLRAVTSEFYWSGRKQ
jgi:hypothetical protein